MVSSQSRLRRSLERAGPLGVALVLGAVLVFSSGLSYRDARSAAGFVAERQGISLLHRLDVELEQRWRGEASAAGPSAADLKAALDANRSLGLTYVGLLEGERVIAAAGASLLSDQRPRVGAPGSGHGRMRMVGPGPGAGPPFGPPPPPPRDHDPLRDPPHDPWCRDHDCGPPSAGREESRPPPPPPPPGFPGDRGPPPFADGGPHHPPVPRRPGEFAPGFPPGPHRPHPPLVIEFEPIGSSDTVRRALVVLWLSSSAAVLLTAAAWILSARRHRAERAESQLLAQRHLARLGEMSAVLAHEIRNPLAALKGHAQLLAEQIAEPQAATRVDRVVKEAIRLEQLTNDLLEFARSGAIRLGPANPGELLQRAARATDAARVDVSAAGAPDVVMLDAARMEQVLINLIDNALQVTPPPLRVQVSATGDRDGLVISVRDHGPGVPPADRARIFEPFHTTKTRGTGLGLAVASRIVELHGGRIDVQDAKDETKDDADASAGAAGQPAGGAIFRVVLPPPQREVNRS